MILTLTLNPAVDKTVFVHGIAIGEVQRVRQSHLDPGGKGINVSRVVDRLGWPTIAFGLLAGEIGQIIDHALEVEGVQNHFLHLPGQTRLNVTIFDQDTGKGTSFYDEGPEVGPIVLAQLENEILPWFFVTPVLVLAGSLPPGVPTDTYASLINLAHRRGIKTILDSDGAALQAGVEAVPYMIKPNVEEAERLLGRKLPDRPAVIQAAVDLAARGIAVVVISMGAEGAICAAEGKVWRAVAPSVARRSTVGSGDSLVAGMALAFARGDSVVEGLRLGTAAGAATAMEPGTTLASPDDVRALLPKVQIEELSLTGRTRT